MAFSLLFRSKLFYTLNRDKYQYAIRRCRHVDILNKRYVANLY